MGDVRIDFVETDDWCALYIDGESRYQGHSMSASSLLAELGRSKGLLEGCRVTDTYFAADEPLPGAGVAGKDWGQLPDQMPKPLQNRVDGYG